VKTEFEIENRLDMLLLILKSGGDYFAGIKEAIRELKWVLDKEGE
jgi:hypothetical protein